MENRELFLQYNKYLEAVSKHLARIQVGRSFKDQWPTDAFNFNSVLGEEWILEVPKTMLNKQIKVESHSNKLSFLFLPLLEKKVLFREYAPDTVKEASLELFKMLNEIREDPACSNCLNIHRSKIEFSSFLYENVRKLKVIISLLNAISEMSSPVYRSLSYEFHGPYDNVCLREYYIDFDPITDIKFSCKIIEKVTKPIRVDFFGHVIGPEEPVEYTLFLNNKEIDPKELSDFLLNVFKEAKKEFSKFNRKELIINCAKLISKKLQNIGLKTKIRENFEIKERKIPDLPYEEWFDIIWNKTVDHLKF